MSIWTSSIRTIVAILAGSLMLAANAVVPVTFTVDSIADEIDDNTLDVACHTAAGTCTLRAAIMQANKINGDVTINVPAGKYVLTIAPAVGDGDDSGDLSLTLPPVGNPTISIVGAGRAATIVDANQIDRVFAVAGGRTASISGLTIRNGKSNFSGGGISNSGTLTLTDVIVSGNQALFGGGIVSDGNSTLTIQDSTIGGNHTTSGDGGGIRYTGTGVLNIARSTIAGNTAAASGGGLLSEGVMFVINSTIAGNKAGSYGGGFYSYATASLNANVYNSTIAYNVVAEGTMTFDQGGGVYLDTSGTDFNGFNVYNTILAMNTSGNFQNNCSGHRSLKTHARNLFGTTTYCTIDPISGSYELLDPSQSLGPLEDNGGPTQTIALLAGSNAIDGTSVTGSVCYDSQSAVITVDQRGFLRNDGTCDVGAYEYNDIFTNGFELH